MSKLYKIELTYNELILVDGKVNADAQVVIDKSKEENKIGFDLPIMNEIIVKSIESGILKWRFKRIDHCSYCDKDYGYYTYNRNSRNHRKGENNYDKPKTHFGIAFNEDFITIKDHGDMCSGCAANFKIVDKLCDYIIKNELPIEIKTKPEISLYLKDEIKICYECGEEMQESKMGKLPAALGGSYPGKCPYCFAESTFFGKSHKHTDKFVMIRK